MSQRLLRDQTINKNFEMFPYDIIPIEGERKELLKSFTGQTEGFVEVGPKKYLLPLKYKDHAEGYYNFEPRSDDLWIMTYPRSGTTWSQELLWLLNNDLDYESAAKTAVDDRFPFIEYNSIFSEGYLDNILELNGSEPEVLDFLERRRMPGYELADNMDSPRHIKTHLPPSLLPPNLVDTSKVVYVARNPFDVAVSFYHHNRLLLVLGFDGDFEKYWDLFEQDLNVYGPHLEHIKEGWELRDHPNFLFLFYEDILRDLPGHLKKISEFLNKSYTDDQIEELANHLQIDNFRKNVIISSDPKLKGTINPDGQNFIRRGKIGGNEEYSEELKERAMKWFEANYSDIELEFPEFEV